MYRITFKGETIKEGLESRNEAVHELMKRGIQDNPNTKVFYLDEDDAVEYEISIEDLFAAL